MSKKPNNSENMEIRRLCCRCHMIFMTPIDQIRCQEISCRGTLLEVDENMLLIIQTLRRKGYKTLFSCSGHVDHPDLYIMFGENYKFNAIPKNFRVETSPCSFSTGLIRFDERKNSPDITVIRAVYKNKTDHMHIQRQTWKHLGNLLKWAINLEEVK